MAKPNLLHFVIEILGDIPISQFPTDRAVKLAVELVQEFEPTKSNCSTDRVPEKMEVVR